MTFAQAESLRSSLHKLEGLLKDYSPLMKESTEKTLETVFKFGAAFAEVSSPIWNLQGLDTLLVERYREGCVQYRRSHV